MLVHSAATESTSNHSNDDKLRLVSLLLAVNSRHVGLLHKCLNLVKYGKNFGLAGFGQIYQKMAEARQNLVHPYTNNWQNVKIISKKDTVHLTFSPVVWMARSHWLLLTLWPLSYGRNLQKSLFRSRDSLCSLMVRIYIQYDTGLYQTAEQHFTK